VWNYEARCNYANASASGRELEIVLPRVAAGINSAHDRREQNAKSSRRHTAQIKEKHRGNDFEMISQNSFCQNEKSATL